MAGRRALLGLAVAVLGAGGGGSAQASTVVFVCAKDLCRANERGGEVQRLTRDGARAGGYSRPSLSHDGRVLSYKRGDPGRVYTAQVSRRGLRARTRIAAAPDGPRDATQFDVAISRDGRRVAWVEQRVNVVSGGIDFRRYLAGVDGSATRQVASSGGRPFVAFYDTTRILREGLTEATDAGQEGEAVDQGICVPDPATETNGTCRGDGALQVAFDPSGRHLRHPARSPSGNRVVATAYAGPEGIDSAIERPGAIVLFDAATAAPLRDLTRGPDDSYAGFSPDGRSVIFQRGRGIWTVPVAGGAPRRLIARGAQPTWGR